MTGPYRTPRLRVALRADRIPPSGLRVRIEATPEDREALAARIGTVSVPSCLADLEVRPWHAQGIMVTGEIRATVVQDCVVSLEPVEASLEVPVREALWPADIAAPEDTGEVVVDIDDQDQPEPFFDGEFRLFDIVSDCLALSLDPYPRKPGAHLDGAEPPPEGGDDGQATGAPKSPFAALKALKPGGAKN